VSTAAFSSSAILKQARGSTHDTKITSRHVTIRTTRRACRVVTTQQVEFGLIDFQLSIATA